MATSTQLLKAYGYLPEVAIGDLRGDTALAAAGLIDSDILAGRLCGHPDEPDEEIAATDPNDLAAGLGMEVDDALQLKTAHARMFEAAGSGSWPPGCHQSIYPHPDRHCVTYYVKRGTFNDNYMRPADESEIRHVYAAGVWPWSSDEMLDRWRGKPILDVGLELLREAYRRVGFWMMEVNEPSAADIILLSRFISGSTIGIGWFPRPGDCSDVVESHYDSSWGPRLYKLSLLLNHEVGHNMGLRHQFQGQDRTRAVMSYNWPNNTYGFLTGNEGILPRDPSWGALTEFTGGDAIPTDQPEHPPQPPSGKPIIEDIHIRIADSTYVYEVKLKGDDDDVIPIGV